jgi:hypothetical protein
MLLWWTPPKFTASYPTIINLLTWVEVFSTHFLLRIDQHIDYDIGGLIQRWIEPIRSRVKG